MWQMDAGDYVAIIALIASIVSFFINRAHTDKIFRQSSNPELAVKAELRDPVGAFFIQVQNLHASVATSNLDCVIAFRLQPEKWRNSKSPWTDYCRESVPPIRPL